jgi:hypothetical protein
MGIVSAAQLHVVDDIGSAKWIAARLGGQFGAVGLTVPRGYSAYARICHPATNKAGEQVSWSEVAKVTGRRPHASMQWHAILGSPDYPNLRSSLWDGADPSLGGLDHFALTVLCDRLAEDAGKEPGCYFSLWEGYGGLEKYGWLEDVAPPRSKVDGQDRHILTADEINRSRSRLHLPHRDYVVLEGPLRGALRIGRFSLGIFWPQSPNIFWPADYTWCVASEIDFDSTLVGGSARLIEAILDTPELDAWPVASDDSLAYDADMVNHMPGFIGG